ncbi:MAG: hypothetical protein QUV10_10320 [Paracoccaceae bacterium]|jgi:hypothetical protein|uniref:hypothetical protein n=1 Tax=unclassified Seohaeicola TaxID=2641111 RepID=UPI00237C18C4|nr:MULTISPECIES: hypothetical protein [unclassified Seohaeicola]MDF1708319.1 hypothetical protein [Paracoccaceae bacterium]MDD9707469.1 hypothetical protein [Seohaeicola sp. 4SK31]MDD9735556.1 hypothetical protein [Seohaeicola sp. SP36]MDM7970005.1 hypothetical protein [Paracoccaceae bacterium]HSG55966.1 hypothetical protein [Paracoccaceae bacterium]
MNDLSGIFQADPDSLALQQSTPPEAPMAMPPQVLEQRPRSVLSFVLAAFRPARQPSRGV